MSRPRRRPYKESCKRASELLASGKTPAQASLIMTREGCWLAIRGGLTWSTGTVRSAVSRVPSITEAPAPAPEPSEAPSIARPRPLMRMLSATEWESMPETVRKAITEAIVRKVVGE